MRVLVTGAAGQVGREVVRLAGEAGVEAVGLGRAVLDVTDAAAVRDAVASVRPDAVVHTAAYTAVDRAESEPETAMAVNRDGARHVAEAAADAGAALVHISTDYVFDGTKDGPYAPDDPPSPVNVYGTTKAEGEAAVRDAHPSAVVLRTAWVISRYDGNFVSTMWRLAAERPRLGVVADQWGHPTVAADLARAALRAAERARNGLSGVLHVAGSPLATWHDLARTAVEAGARLGAVPEIPVDPIPTSDYPTPARRPQRVELALADSFAALDIDPFDWRASVEREARARFGPGPL